MYCKNCGKQIEDSSKFCEFCGASLTDDRQQIQPTEVQSGIPPPPPNFPYQQGYSQPIQVQNQPQQQLKSDGEIKTIAIIGVVFSGIGIFVFPILGIVGIITGIIGLSKTPKEEKEWTKAIWKYQNKARGLSMLALFLGIIDILWIFLKLL